MSDKLHLLSKVDEMSRDPELYRKMDELVAKRRMMFKAMESIKKSGTF